MKTLFSFIVLTFLGTATLVKWFEAPRTALLGEPSATLTVEPRGNPISQTVEPTGSGISIGSLLSEPNSEQPEPRVETPIQNAKASADQSEVDRPGLQVREVSVTSISNPSIAEDANRESDGSHSRPESNSIASLPAQNTPVTSTPAVAATEGISDVIRPTTPDAQGRKPNQSATIDIPLPVRAPIRQPSIASVDVGPVSVQETSPAAQENVAPSNAEQIAKRRAAQLQAQRRAQAKKKAEAQKKQLEAQKNASNWKSAILGED